MKMNFAFLMILILSSGLMFAQSSDIGDNPQLGHYLSADEIGKTSLREFSPTDPPAEARNIAEFESMEGVLIRYPFGINYQLIAAMSAEDKVVTVVSSSSQQNTVTSSYTSNGVNLDNCEFLIAPSNSYWTRDYGPWYIYDGSEVAIVNFIYNRPRPDDNDMPIAMAGFLGIDLYGMSVEQTGGNYMTDGCGISAASDLVIEENPNLSVAQINQYMEDFLGINTYYTIPDPNNTYIDHIDCWGKFLGVDKVLIREVPATHAQYDEIEATADYFAGQNCSWGYPYEVFRVNTPNNQPYTNSLILNKRVFVPITGSGWDDDALAAYEEAMPGYEIAGFTGSWESTDALHCRSKGIADRQMIHIAHQPYFQEENGGTSLTFSAEITAYSGEALVADSVYIAWSIDGIGWNTMGLIDQGNNLWQADLQLPAANTELYYYLHAMDADGNESDHPIPAENDPHGFSLVFNEMQYGDVDSNSIVETYDAALLLQYIVGLDPLPELDPLPWEDARIEAADVDSNEVLGSYDASLIMQYVVGIIEELPIGE